MHQAPGGREGLWAVVWGVRRAAEGEREDKRRQDPECTHSEGRPRVQLPAHEKGFAQGHERFMF